MKANRGSFKKGNRPGNTARVGDETLTDDGYIRVKVAEPNRWELKHRLVWEKYRGEIPENGVIRFIIVRATGSSSWIFMQDYWQPACCWRYSA